MRTIAHLSDLHFGRIDEKLLAPLRRKLQEVAPHLVVVSGDLTQRARAEQFRAARSYLVSLPQPLLVVPGNHDIPLYNVAMRFLAPLHHYRRIVSEDLEPHFIDAEIAVVGVNTARSFTFKGGRVNKQQVDRVRAKLCGLPEDVTKVLVTHHPFDVPKDSHEGDQIVGRARMALAQLAGCGADLLLSGHLHEAHVGHSAERYSIAGLSALVVQSGTATSSRTRKSTNSFNVLRMDAGHIEIDLYQWNESSFEIAATHAFDHGAGGWNVGTCRDASH